MTDVKLGSKKLTPYEDKIYQLIVKRLLAIFMDPYVVDKTQMTFTCGGEHFKATGNVVIDEGYTVLYNAHKKKQVESNLPALAVGEKRSVKDAEGIGKSATRAEILEKLVAVGMLTREGK